MRRAERELTAHVMKRLEENPSKWGSPAQMGADIKANPVWASLLQKSGGLKCLVARHPQDLRWVDDPRAKFGAMGTILLAKVV